MHKRVERGSLKGSLEAGMRSLIWGFLVLLSVSGLVKSANAAEITVLDPMGNVKATASTEGVNPITVNFQLPEGQTLGDKRVELRNKEDGTVIPGTVSGSTVVFENVPAGTYELLAEPELIALAGVEIGADPSLAGAASVFGNNTAMGILGGAVAAGGAATGITLGTESDSHHHPLSPAS